jgi:Spy/CpxP family protein refolding chaperone
LDQALWRVHGQSYARKLSAQQVDFFQSHFLVHRHYALPHLYASLPIAVTHLRIDGLSSLPPGKVFELTFETTGETGMDKRKMLAAAALASGLMTASAFAFPGRGCSDGIHGRGWGDGHGTERMAEWLDLSTDQRTSVRAIEDKYRPQLRSLRGRMTETRKALIAATTQPRPNDAQVRMLADAQGKAMADMIVLRTRMFGEMRLLLTDAQRTKLRNFRERKLTPKS